MTLIDEPSADGEGDGQESHNCGPQGNDTPHTTDVNQAFAFLRKLQPEGPWLVCRFDPWPKYWLSKDEHSLAQILSMHEADWYVLIGEMRCPRRAKPKKRDMAGSRWLWVDVDPDPMADESADQLVERIMPLDPDLIVRSGRGAWGLSELNDLGRQQEIEAANLWFRRKVGGDSCHNIERVMRLPGTINSKSGTRATWELVRKGKPRPLSSFSREEASKDSEAIREIHADEIDDLEIPKKAREAVLTVPDGSRNEIAFSFLTSCVAAGVPDDLILGIALCRDLPVSDYFYRDRTKDCPRPDPIRFARRQLSRATDKVEACKSQKAESPQFKTSKDGYIIKCYENARAALQHLGVTLSYDFFSQRMHLGGHELQQFAGPPTDQALVVLRDLVIRNYGFDPKKENVSDAVSSLCMENIHDALLDHLDALKWDGIPRLDDWLVRIYGAEDTPYVRAVGRLLLRAMVRRPREPGVKFDHMVVLEGAQGLGKSLSFAILAGRDEWFSDETILSYKDKGRAEMLQGIWINEVAELAGITKAEREDLKAFITRRVDRYRPSYGKVVEDWPRRGVLVGTTNEGEWLSDSTGQRRFLPVRVKKVEIDLLRTERDQLIAEADATGAGSLVLPKEVLDAARAEQSDRQRAHAWDDILRDLTPETSWGGKDRCSAPYILCNVLRFQLLHLKDRSITSTLKECMLRQGWSHGTITVTRGSSDRSKGYWREAAPSPRGQKTP